MSKGLHALKELKKRYGKNFSLQDDERTHIIEKELKNYEELTNRPVLLCGRTHGEAQKTIDTICKNFKEVKITYLEDKKKVKALEIIKEYFVLTSEYGKISFELKKEISEDKYDLLKEVLL